MVQTGALQIRDVQLGGKSLKTRQKEGVIPIKAGRTEVLHIGTKVSSGPTAKLLAVSLWNTQASSMKRGYP